MEMVADEVQLDEYDEIQQYFNNGTNNQPVLQLPNMNHDPMLTFEENPSVLDIDFPSKDNEQPDLVPVEQNLFSMEETIEIKTEPEYIRHYDTVEVKGNILVMEKKSISNNEHSFYVPLDDTVKDTVGGGKVSLDFAFKCHVCEKIMKHNTSLVRHFKRAHQTSKTFECDVCGKMMKNQDSLRDHVKRVHEKTSLCTHCADQCVCSNANKQFSCFLCKRNYGSKNQLEDHMENTHEKCSECQKRFKNIRTLKAHLLSFHSIKYIIKYKP